MCLERACWTWRQGCWCRNMGRAVRGEEEGAIEGEGGGGGEVGVELEGGVGGAGVGVAGRVE
eukprot:COSAG06_NODE_2303_length_7118_cov_4.980339_4_plen_62_part_00